MPLAVWIPVHLPQLAGAPRPHSPGGGTRFGSVRFVVTQPSSGTFAAYSNVCPHQGCAVSQIKGTEITCPCHESTFSLADGARISGPTPRGLTAAKATVSGETVTVSAV